MTTKDSICDSAIDVVGNTPLVALDRITAGRKGRILAKLDMLNPGFSKKDRAAKEIILEAERTGALKPGQTVIELTSGNMGTGLAIMCAVRGYPFIAVMSQGNSAERARMMQALGATVILVAQAPGSRVGEVSGADLALVEQKTVALTETHNAFRADQFTLLGNANAHYKTTGPEIWHQSGGTIDAFCDFAGSGGTFAGCSRYFREQNQGIKCYIVEPEGAAILETGTAPNPDHPIQGGGYAMPDLTQLDGVTPDGYVQISGDEATKAARLLAKKEGIFAGYSSGANLAAALKLLDTTQQGSTIAITICDSGLKYLSTDLWPD